LPLPISPETTAKSLPFAPPSFSQAYLPHSCIPPQTLPILLTRLRRASGQGRKAEGTVGKNVLIIRVLRAAEIISGKNKRGGGGVDEEKGQCPLWAPGAGSAGQPPWPPRPGRGQGGANSRGGAGRGNLRATEVRWSVMGSPRPRCCGVEEGAEPARERGRGAEPGTRVLGGSQLLPRGPHAAASNSEPGDPLSSLPAPDAHTVCNEKSVSGSEREGLRG